jgi:predicted DNA-binding protein
MPEKKPDDSQIVSVRLPHELIQRLDRYLDWSDLYRRTTSSRNAAIREALGNWLDEQEQIAGFLEPQAQRQQLHNAYQSLSKRHDWVAIHQLRSLTAWPRERFDAVVEALRADHQVELERAEPNEMSEQALQESYQVHGQFYSRLRWRRGADR